MISTGAWAHLAGDDGLHEEAEHGEHGQAAVLDLLHLQLGEGVRVVSQAQGVEGATLRAPIKSSPGAAGALMGCQGSAPYASNLQKDTIKARSAG